MTPEEAAKFYEYKVQRWQTYNPNLSRANNLARIVNATGWVDQEEPPTATNTSGSTASLLTDAAVYSWLSSGATIGSFGMNTMGSFARWLGSSHNEWLQRNLVGVFLPADQAASGEEAQAKALALVKGLVLQALANQNVQVVDDLYNEIPLSFGAKAKLWRLTLQNEALGCTKPGKIDPANPDDLSYFSCFVRVRASAPWGNHPISLPAWIDPARPLVWTVDNLDILYNQEVAWKKQINWSRFFLDIGENLPPHWFLYVAPKDPFIAVPFVIEDKKPLLFVKPHS